MKTTINVCMAVALAAMVVGCSMDSSELGEYVRREMQEELGIRESQVADLKMRYITYRLKDGEIRQNYYFFGKLKENLPLKSAEGRLEWIPYDGFEDLTMPVSAKHMILHYLKQGRFDDKIYAGVSEHWGANFAPLGEFDD